MMTTKTDLSFLYYAGHVQFIADGSGSYIKSFEPYKNHIYEENPICNSEVGLSMGFSIYTDFKCLFFIPAQKIKQFCGMFRFIFRKLGKQFGKRRVILLEFMGIGLIVPAQVQLNFARP